MEETEERSRKDLPSTISLFNGRNMNGLHWIEAFEIHALCKKLSDEDKLLALPTKLIDTARGWWDLVIAKKPKATWSEIKSSFLEYFANESRPDVAYDALRLLRQGDNETTQNFLIRFHQHARFCTDTQATHLAKLFFVGLAPRGQHVLRGDVPENSTYFTIADTVIKAEKFMNMQSFSVNSVSEREITRSSPASDVELVQSKLNSLEEKLSSLLNNQDYYRVNSVAQRHQGREENYPRRPGRDVTNNYYRNSREDYSQQGYGYPAYAPRPVTCYFCDAPGHLKRDCLEYQEYVASKKGLAPAPQAANNRRN